MLSSPGGVPLSAAAPHERNGHDAFPAHDGTEIDTETPIKHVIVLIGENRTFDHVYGTYVPKDGQSVSNLLSKGIVNADGSPGPHAGDAKQFQLGTINPVAYFISTDKLIDPYKTAYAPVIPGKPPSSVMTASSVLAFRKHRCQNTPLT
jgi:phospholipase C